MVREGAIKEHEGRGGEDRDAANTKVNPPAVRRVIRGGQEWRKTQSTGVTVGK